MGSISPPSPGWIARLQGHGVDLAYWEQRLKASFDPKCEHIPHDGDSVWALRSDQFNHLQTADDVRKCAITLIESLNGALALEGNAAPLTLQSVGCIDSNGQINFTSFAERHERARATDKYEIVVVRDAKSGNLVLPPPPPEPSEAQKWVKAAEGHADIAKAFRHFGQPTNWYDMWTAYEIIEDELWEVLVQIGSTSMRVPDAPYKPSGPEHCLPDCRRSSALKAETS